MCILWYRCLFVLSYKVLWSSLKKIVQSHPSSYIRRQGDVTQEICMWKCIGLFQVSQVILKPIDVAKLSSEGLDKKHFANFWLQKLKITLCYSFHVYTFSQVSALGWQINVLKAATLKSIPNNTWKTWKQTNQNIKQIKKQTNKHWGEIFHNLLTFIGIAGVLIFVILGSCGAHSSWIEDFTLLNVFLAAL